MGQSGSKSCVYESHAALSSTFCDDLVNKLQTHNACTNISVDPAFADEDKVVLLALGEQLKRYLDVMTEQGFKMTAEMGDTGYYVGHADVNALQVWDQNRSPHRIITFIFYLNDAENSETVFNFCNETIRPSKGKFMAFPSSWRNLHMTKVKSKKCHYLIGDVFLRQQAATESVNI